MRALLIKEVSSVLQWNSIPVRLLLLIYYTLPVILPKFKTVLITVEIENGTLKKSRLLEPDNTAIRSQILPSKLFPFHH
jgi:hypothetical protein